LCFREPVQQLRDSVERQEIGRPGVAPLIHREAKAAADIVAEIEIGERC
jgi:hypothetical protein